MSQLFKLKYRISVCSIVNSRYLPITTRHRAMRVIAAAAAGIGRNEDVLHTSRQLSTVTNSTGIQRLQV